VKKCFELNSALESQFKAAANLLTQRGASRSLHENPRDVEIIKFSWTETPSNVLIASSEAAIPISSARVSAPGTRILADPNEKGDPGPGETLNPGGIISTPRRDSKENTKEFIAYKFSISIKNTGSKTIVGIKWAYFFDPKDPAREGSAYLFMSKTNIAPGKE